MLPNAVCVWDNTKASEGEKETVMNHNQNSVRLECLAEAGENRMARIRVGLAVAFLIGTAMVVQGADFTFKSGKSDFTKPENYTVGGVQATERPGANDNVIVPAGTYSLSGHSDSFKVLSGVKRVKPSDGTIFEITVADNDTCTFNAPINHNGGFAYNNPSVRCYGKVVKKGAGTLILAASGRTKSVAEAVEANKKFNMDYFTQIDLQAGTLKLPQQAAGDMYFGDLTMAEGTILVTCGDMTDDETKNKAIFTYLRSLNGSGTITNETNRSGGQTVSPFPRDEIVENVFRGRICHPAKIWLTGRLAQYGSDTGIEQPIVVEGNRGHLNDGKGYGTYSFENVGLLGPATEVKLYGLGGGIHYFGLTDATISKTMNLYSYSYSSFVDAGSHGGLTFSGDWYAAADSANSAVQKWLVLTGSNSVPCKISGKFVENNFSGKDYATDSPRTIFTQKLGAGAWRFTGTRNHGGGFAIEEGTLQFDSVAEKGIASALGRSTNLTTACSVRDPEYVDYAFSLGSTKATAPAAAFEFTGSKSCQCSTRPLVLTGKGGALKASGSGDARIGFGGISARDAGETTLTLNGASELSNVATGITDGNGVVNVVKDGEGKWYLSGTNTFSGDLRVKAGTLIVQGSKYTWFRFTVKETGNKGSYLALRQFALYDEKGVRQNICLNVNTDKKVLASFPNNVYKYFPDSDWMALEPGSFAFGSDSFLCKYNSETDYMYVDQIFSDVGNTTNDGIERFDGIVSKGGHCQLRLYNLEGKDTSINKETPESWISFVMRLTNGTPAIASYDIQSYYNSNGTNMWPKVGTMEASVDGIHWDFVELNGLGDVMVEHEYDFSIPLNAQDDTSNRWYFDGSKQVNWDPSYGTTARPGKGFPLRGRADIPTPLATVRSVAVDSGATLKTDEPITISALKIYGTGVGTMDGFTFAQTGVIDIVFDGDVPSSATIPGAYVNCNGFANLANWTLKVNGAANNKYFASMKNDGTLVFARRGLVVTFR